MVYSSGEAVAALGSVLHSLGLARNAIGDAGAAALGGLLRSSDALTSLRLEGNELGATGAASLAEGWVRVRVRLAYLPSPIPDPNPDPDLNPDACPQPSRPPHPHLHPNQAALQHWAEPPRHRAQPHRAAG